MRHIFLKNNNLAGSDPEVTEVRSTGAIPLKEMLLTAYARKSILGPDVKWSAGFDQQTIESGFLSKEHISKAKRHPPGTVMGKGAKMAAPIKNRKGNLSILASSVFCLIGMMFLSFPAWAGPLVIGYTSNQMATHGTQNLTVSGGCGGPYTWSIGSGGGGFLSSSTGTSVTYTAPSSNPSCSLNPTILVTDNCGFSQTLRIAINGYTSHDHDAYSRCGLDCTCTIGAAGGAVFSVVSDAHFCDDTVRAVSGCSVMTCGAGIYYCPVGSECAYKNDWCANNWNAQHPHTADMRFPSMIQQGCCPVGLMPPPPPPG